MGHCPAGLLREEDLVLGGLQGARALQAATYRVVVPVPACVPHCSPVSGPCHLELEREETG